MRLIGLLSVLNLFAVGLNLFVLLALRIIRLPNLALVRRRVILFLRSIGLVHCDAKRIDEWMDDGSLNSLEVLLFSEAIEDAAEPQTSLEIFLDACDVNADRFGRGVSRTLGDSWHGCKIYSEHKMDTRDEVVAAASIIAKVSRDSVMEDLSR